MKISYSDGIVLALARHKTLNIMQLATKISHDHGKTKHLVGFMARNDKLRVSQQNVNGEKAYELTDTGRQIAERLQAADTATPRIHTPQPLMTHAHDIPKPEPKQIVEKPMSPPIPASLDSEKPRHPVASVQPQSKFGLLNTGELIILLPESDELGRQYTTIIPAAEVSALRTILQAQP